MSLSKEDLQTMRDKLDGIKEFVKMLNYPEERHDLSSGKTYSTLRDEDGCELIGKTKRDWMRYWATHTIPEGIPLNPQLEYKPVWPGWSWFMGVDYPWWGRGGKGYVAYGILEEREKRWAPDFDIMAIYNKWKEDKRQEANEDLQSDIFNFIGRCEWDSKTAKIVPKYGGIARWQS